MQSAGILRVQTTCPTCQGAGQVISDPCDECAGQRFRQHRVELDVNIPPGIDDGMQVRLSGEGEPSAEGGPPGDCYCLVHVQEHSLFQRDGNDLFLQIPVSYTQAALGADLEIPTLDGPEVLSIPAGTQSGEIFRLKQLGMPNPRGGTGGDLLVQAYVEVPKHVTGEQERLLRELAELEDSEVTPHRESFLEKIKGYFNTSNDHSGA